MEANELRQGTSMDRYIKLKQRILDEGYTFNSPAALQEVEAFEQRHGILLPEAYRSFLLHVADGGTMIDGARLLRLSELEVDLESVGSPFPLTDYCVWENDESMDENKQKTVCNGNVALMDMGDCQTWNIILSGASTGEMWFFTDVGVQPACPRRDFVSWFEYWLDGGEDYFSGFVYEA
jgi:hypothetical protein